MVAGVTSLDGRLAVWITTHRYAPLNDVFVWLGQVDRLGAVWVGLALVVSYSLRRRALSAVGTGLSTGLTTATADGITFGVKDLVHRTRPSLAHPQIHPLYVVHSSSFPSGHAASAFAGAVLLSYLAPRAAPFFVVLAAAIAFSRVYVGVHYPGDVVVGAAIGAAVGTVAAMLLRVARPEQRAAGHSPRQRTRVVARNG